LRPDTPWRRTPRTPQRTQAPENERCDRRSARSRRRDVAHGPCAVRGRRRDSHPLPRRRTAGDLSRAANKSVLWMAVSGGLIVFGGTAGADGLPSPVWRASRRPAFWSTPE
jgi:hypothetical protein